MLAVPALAAAEVWTVLAAEGLATVAEVRTALAQNARAHRVGLSSGPPSRQAHARSEFVQSAVRAGLATADAALAAAAALGPALVRARAVSLETRDQPRKHLTRVSHVRAVAAPKISASPAAASVWQFRRATSSRFRVTVS